MEGLEKYNTIGSLEIIELGELGRFENVECFCEYSDLPKSQKGYFKIKSESGLLFGELIKCNSPFIFSTGTEFYIEGVIKGPESDISFVDEYFSLLFKINILKFSNESSTDKESMLEIRFNTPFISLFARPINYVGKIEENLISLDNEDFKFNVLDYNFRFKEYFQLFGMDDLNHKLNIDMFLDIKKELNSKENYYEQVNKISTIVDKIFVIITLIINRRIQCNGSSTYGENLKKEPVSNQFYRDYRKYLGDNFFVNDWQLYSKFREIFNQDAFSELCNSYLNLTSKDQTRMKNFIYSLCNCIQLELFDAKFLNGYFLLEAVSKHIVNPADRIKGEDLILSACNMKKIEIRFNGAKNSKKLKWHITEFRNELTHFNDSLSFSEELHGEYKKMLILCRKLIFSCINEKFTNFPFYNYFDNLEATRVDENYFDIYKK